MEEYRSKDYIKRRISEITGYNLKDVAVMLKALEQIFVEIVCNRDILYWKGFFKLYTREVKAGHKAYNVYTKELQQVKSYLKIFFVASRTFYVYAKKVEEKRKLLEEATGEVTISKIE